MVEYLLNFQPGGSSTNTCKGGNSDYYFKKVAGEEHLQRRKITLCLGDDTLHHLSISCGCLGSLAAKQLLCLLANN